MSRLPFAAQDPVAGDSFRHEAFLYAGDEHFVAGMTAFTRGALDAGEAVLVAVVEPRATLLRQALGDDAARVDFLDIERVGRNPARIIPAWQDWVDRHASDGRGFRGIGEPIWADRTPSEVAECQQHELLLNTAFDGGPGWWLLCPYDVSSLSAPVIERAHATHPTVFVDDIRTRSASYPRSESGSGSVSGSGAVSGYGAVKGGTVSAEPLKEPLEEPPGPVWEIRFDLASLGALRESVARFAEPVVDRRGKDNAVLVVSELAANSIKYGGGAGILRLWRDGLSLVCEVRDHGVITDPLVGRRRPSALVGGKAGLWIANQVCDLLQIRSAPGRGTVVRARLGGAAGT